MTHEAEIPLAVRYGPRAVIAGGSEGIGEALAHRLAEAGIDLVLIARSEARLRAVAADIEATHGRDVRVLPLDLTDPGTHQAVAESCGDLEIGLLVYAAGSVNRTLDFADDPYEASLRQVELNCVGPLGLARALGPAMLARGRGGIVTLASVGARNQAIAARVWPDRRSLVQMIGAHASAHAARTSATA